jgi:hypothetical protein
MRSQRSRRTIAVPTKSRIAVIIIICVFLAALSWVIVWAYNTVSAMVVHYTFDVPQKFNATYFTMDTPRILDNIDNQTLFPYVFHDWTWEGHTVSLTVHYWVPIWPNPQPPDFNGTNIAPAKPQVTWEEVGSETFNFVATNHPGGV